jgi:hypothetical protein
VLGSLYGSIPGQEPRAKQQQQQQQSLKPNARSEKREAKNYSRAKKQKRPSAWLEQKAKLCALIRAPNARVS